MKQLAKIFFAATVCFYFFGNEAQAANGNSNSTGNWNNPSTWLFAGTPRVPACGDTVNVISGITVTVNSQENLSACVSPLTLFISGTLQFTNGNKLSLPCGSMVYILPGGLVRKATSGGGNSTFIEICNITYWSAADGDVTGPDTLGPSSLPISLLSFTAEPAENKIDVSWATASETNNDYFTVEKSADGTDFTSMGTVDGAGNSSVTLNYFYPDYSPVNGVSYYRLKQTDYDGQFSYSQIVQVSYLSASPFAIVAAFVSGTSDFNLFFNASAKEKCSMEIYDVLGKNIFQTNVEGTRGVNKKEFKIPRLISGIYFVTLTSGNKSVSRKFIKE